MNVKLIPPQNTFGITVKPPKKIDYAPLCWNIKQTGKYKGYDIFVYNDYVQGVHSSTLISLSKAGKWIKSKLKYMLDGERKTLWSYAGVKGNDRMV